MSWMKSKQIEPLVEKLRQIVLSSAPLVEIDPNLQRMFELWREFTRGTITDDDERAHEIVEAIESVPSPTKSTMIWEPLSDARGEPIRHYGWNINATIYLLNGQPWWLVRADHNRDRTGPTDIEKKRLDKVLALLGCADLTRDLLRAIDNEADELTLKWSRHYSWFHRGLLYETHENKKTHVMRVVLEGTPLPTDFERIPRLDINNLPK